MYSDKSVNNFHICSVSYPWKFFKKEGKFFNELLEALYSLVDPNLSFGLFTGITLTLIPSFERILLLSV